MGYVCLGREMLEHEYTPFTAWPQNVWRVHQEKGGQTTVHAHVVDPNNFLDVRMLHVCHGLRSNLHYPRV